jgi:hypothetical protein
MSHAPLISGEAGLSVLGSVSPDASRNGVGGPSRCLLYRRSTEPFRDTAYSYHLQKTFIGTGKGYARDKERSKVPREGQLPRPPRRQPGLCAGGPPHVGKKFGRRSGDVLVNPAGGHKVVGPNAHAEAPSQDRTTTHRRLPASPTRAFSRCRLAPSRRCHDAPSWGDPDVARRLGRGVRQRQRRWRPGCPAPVLAST